MARRLQILHQHPNLTAHYTLPSDEPCTPVSPTVPTTPTRDTSTHPGHQSTLLTTLTTLWRRGSSFLRALPRVHQILLIGVVILALVAAALALPHRHTTTQVVARTTRVLRSGTIITDHDVEWVTLPSNYVPNSAIHSAKELHERPLIGDSAAGEILTQERLSTPALPAGWRAVSVPVDNPNYWRVGQHVDVVANTGKHTKLLCEDALIHSTTPTGGGISTLGNGVITLALPEDRAYAVATLDPDAYLTLLLR